MVGGPPLNSGYTNSHLHLQTSSCVSTPSQQSAGVRGCLLRPGSWAHTGHKEAIFAPGSHWEPSSKVTCPHSGPGRGDSCAQLSSPSLREVWTEQQPATMLNANMATSTFASRTVRTALLGLEPWSLSPGLPWGNWMGQESSQKDLSPRRGPCKQGHYFVECLQ